MKHEKSRWWNQQTDNQFFFVSLKNKKPNKQNTPSASVWLFKKAITVFCVVDSYIKSSVSRDGGMKWERGTRAQQYRTLTTKQQIERELFDWLGRMRGQSNKAEQMRATTRGADRPEKMRKRIRLKIRIPIFFHQHKDVRLVPLRPFQDDLMAKPIRHPRCQTPRPKRKKPFLDPPSSSTQLKTIIGWPPFKPNQ